MVEVGGKPVLWHIMKILSAQGIRDFVVCTGYKSEYIANYFANYGSLNKDFTVTLGTESSIVYHDHHEELDWKVTVAYTGAATMTGGRIKRVQKYVGREPFLCTYGDGIAPVDVRALQDFHSNHGKLATMTTTRPYSRFGVVDINRDGDVASFREKPQSDDWINIGYFIFEPAIFDYLSNDDTVLEQEPLHRLADQGQLSAFRHDGFWQPMDTYRESQMLNELWATGTPPWKIWD
ncbi:glucose-1-phosphate cytidylyltransferase [Microbacterium sp. SORGH_AS 888]|nr:glucose-1-phosphate cytidylyltransferase [Microbacterium sp. SORGH_AS_0888]